MKAPELIHYRDYIRSPYWTERKRLYFATHSHKCEVCGHPDVELHHLHYGDYGHERDKNLAALCRVHHQELHDSVPPRKNTSYQSRYIIEEMKINWKQMQNAPLQSIIPAKRATQTSFASIVDRLARPIWRFIKYFF